jgi:mono/diheme cytochrome c family protein
MRMLIALALLVGCSKNDEPPPPTTGSPMAQPESGPKGKKAAGAVSEQAQQMFMTVCATCHGADGSGNGPAAETLNPKPRNYTDPAWQASVTDEDLRKTILLGGQGVGKSPMMPGNPQLKDDAETLDGLVRIIRGFGKK